MYRWVLLLLLIAANAKGGPNEPSCDSVDGKDAPFPTAAMPPEVQRARRECIGQRLADFVSRDGSKFRDVTVKRADDFGIAISHSTGAKILRYEDLPPEIQKEFIGKAIPLMTPEVSRRYAIHRSQREIEALEKRVAKVRNLQKSALSKEQQRKDRNTQTGTTLKEQAAKLEEQLAGARRKLAAEIEESKKLNDDPAAFDRYHAEYGFPPL